ncbi:MAG: APC family permease [Kiritimatiellae bacterium]|nr:APC family permease [Kiritimatiellia bacterium]
MKHGLLQRQLGLWGAVMMGMGAMVGTGVFVSIGVAAGIAGAAVVPAILVAAGVAVCNALSSAQLAASHPVSGGTYEYGYKYLTPSLGFTAGWMFLCAKSASAATAALGFGGYLLHVLGRSSPMAVTVLGASVSILVTLLVLSGLKRSNLANILIVSATLIALTIFVGFAGSAAIRSPDRHLFPLYPRDRESFRAFLQACALMFVAYTGYGRIATMGEEVKEPRKIIPRAIIAVTAVSAVLYMAVGLAAIGSFGADALGEATRTQAAPLETVLRSLGHPAAAALVALGAMTAMLGVLLNLILGLSRVALAMGRRGDLPTVFAKIDTKGATPVPAVLGVGVLVTALAVLGDVQLTWSFSAFTVLVYYAITNLSALRLDPEHRLYPRWISYTGIVACLFLAFWVDPAVWITGLGLIAAGLVWHKIRKRL